jgi:hypothetical protein
MSLLYALGVIQTFYFNKTWSFRHGGTHGPAFIRYCISYGLGYLFNLAALHVLVDRLGTPPDRPGRADPLHRSPALPAAETLGFPSHPTRPPPPRRVYEHPLQQALHDGQGTLEHRPGPRQRPSWPATAISPKRCSRWLEARTGANKALLTHSCTAALEMAAISPTSSPVTR